MAAPQFQIQVRELCPECYGAGNISISTPYCGVCHRSFTDAQLHGHSEHSWRAKRNRLPCSHRIKHVRWTDPTCPSCGGTGGQMRWLPLEWALRMQTRLQEQQVGRGRVTTRPIQHGTAS